MRKYILFLFIYISCICSINGQDQNSTAIGFYTSGLDSYNKQNYEDAVADYTKAIELNEGFAEAYFQRGCAKHNIDDYKGAVEDFNTSIKLQPNNEVLEFRSPYSTAIRQLFKNRIHTIKRIQQRVCF